MSLRLNGKVAIITGGSSGIGRDTALLFIKEGANVVITDVNTDGGNETVKLAENIISDNNLSNRIVFQYADVSKSLDVQHMINTAIVNFGNLHILFNNAGIMHPKDDDAINTEEDIWDLTMNINLKGVYLGCKYAIPEIRKSGGGSIINTASKIYSNYNRIF